MADKKKPERHKGDRWKAGTSGNPGGCARKAFSVALGRWINDNEECFVKKQQKLEEYLEQQAQEKQHIEDREESDRIIAKQNKRSQSIGLPKSSPKIRSAVARFQRARKTPRRPLTGRSSQIGTKG